MNALFQSLKVPSLGSGSERKWLGSLLLLAWVLISTAPFEAPAQDLEALQPFELRAFIAERYDQLYVPDQDLGQLWSAQDGVLLKTEEFEQLFTRAVSNDQANTKLPADIVVEDIVYELKLEGDLCQILVRCQLKKLAAGWQELELPLDRVHLRSAQINGKPAPLGLSEQTQRPLLLDNFVGQRELTIALTTPIQRMGTDELIQFSVFPKLPASLLLTVPEGRLLQLNGQSIQAAGSALEARKVEIPVGGLAGIQLRLTDDLGQSLNESLVFAATEYAVAVEQDYASWQARCQVSLFGKRFHQLEFQVPVELEMTNVEAPGLQAWELLDDPNDPDQTRIKLSFREALPERFIVQFSGVQLLGDAEQLRLAGLKLLGVTSHTGGVAVAAFAPMRLKTGLMEGVRTSTRRWQPAGDILNDRQPQFYDIWEEDFVLELSVSAPAQEIQGAVSHTMMISEQDVRLSSVITLQTLFAPLFEVTMELPDKWRPEVILDGQETLDWKFLSQNDGRQQIRISLTKPLKPGAQRTLQVTLLLQRESGTFTSLSETIPLPDLKLQQVRILEGTYAILANPLLEVVPRQMTGMDPAFLGIPGERFGYRYQDSIIAGELLVSRKAARLNTSTVEQISLNDQQAQLEWKVDLDIHGGGIRELEINITGLANQEAEFRSLSQFTITEQIRVPTETGMKWKLTFDRFVTGSGQLYLQINLPHQLAETFVVPELSVAIADLQEQYLLFAAEEDQQLRLSIKDAAGKSLVPLDVADYPRLPRQGNQRMVAGYQTNRPGFLAEVEVSQFDAAAIPTAIARQLFLSSFLLDAGHFQQDATLNFAASGVQSLMIELPANSDLWSTTLDGTPVTARQVGAGFLVSISGLSDGAEEHQLRLTYGINQQESESTENNHKVIPHPIYSAVDGRGTVQPLQILQSDWKVHHLPHSRVEPRRSGVTVVRDSLQRSWKEDWLDYFRQLSVFSVGIKLISGLLLCGLLLLLISSLRSIWENSFKPDQKTRWWLVGSLLLLIPTLGFAGLCLLVAAPSSIQTAREASRAPATGFVIMENAPQETEADIVKNQFESYETNMDGSELAASIQLAEPEAAAKPSAETAPEFNPFGDEQRRARDQKMPLNAAPPTPPLYGLNGVVDGLADTPVPTTQPANSLGLADDRAKQLRGLSRSEVQAESPSQPLPSIAGEQLEKSGDTDGYLSLNINLPSSDRFTTTQFRSLQSLSSESLPIRYYSEQKIVRLKWLIVFAGLFSCWLLRHASMVFKLTVLTLLAGTGLAIIGPLPEVWLPVLEGLFVLLLSGLIIWTVSRLLQGVRLRCCLPKAKSAGNQLIAGCLLLGAATLCSEFCPAEEVLSAPVTSKVPLIYPYQEGQRPTAGDRVFVPREEYLRLWQSAHPEKITTPAPYESLIHEVTYLARLEKSGPEKKPTVLLKGRFVIESYRTQPQLIRLPIQGAVIEAMQIGDRKTDGTVSDKQEPMVLLPGQGVFLVDVDFRLPVESFGQAGRLNLNLLPVASGWLAFELPSDELQLTINDGKIPFQLIATEERTTAEWTINTGENYSLAWQPKVSESQLQFLSCDSTREARLHHQGADLQYTYRFKISQGSFSEVGFRMPAGIKLKSISGNDVAGWQLTPEGQLRILLKRSVEDQTDLTLTLFAPYELAGEATAFSLPDVVPEDITREIGDLAIGWDPSLTVRFTRTDAVRQLPSERYQPLVKTTILSNRERVYRFSTRPFHVTTEITATRLQIEAEQFTAVDIQFHKTHLASVIDLNIQGEARLFAEFELPRNLELIELSGPAVEDWFVQTADDAQRAVLTVLFSAPQQGKLQIFLRGYILQSAQAQQQLTIPCLRPRQITRSICHLGIGAADMLSLNLADHAGWQTIEPKRLPAPLQQLVKFPFRLGLKNDATQMADVTLKISRQQSQLKANLVTLLAVSPASIDYGYSFQWQIASAAADQFSFTGPDWLTDKLEFSSSEIRQIETTPLPQQQTLWTIHTQRPQRQQFFCTAAVSLPHTENRQFDLPELKFVQITQDAEPMLDLLESQQHYAVLVNLADETLEPVTDHEQLLVNAAELPIQVPQEMVAQAVEILRLDTKLKPSWIIQPLAEQEAPLATIPLVELFMVIDESGYWRMNATYHVKNQQRQFLPVVLPVQTKLLSVLVDGQPSRAVHQKSKLPDRETLTFIPLPPRGAADLSVPVQIILESQQPLKLTSSWNSSRVNLSVPEILTPEESAEFGIPVLHTVWKLNTPEQLAVKPITGDQTNLSLSNLAAAQRISQQGLLSELSELTRMLAVTKNSYRQRSRAADNIKVLQQKLQLQTGGETVLFDDSQQQILEQAEEKLNEAQLDSLASTNQLGLSVGRSYIEGNNYTLNNLNGGTALPFQSQAGQVPNQQPAVIDEQERFNRPQAVTEPQSKEIRKGDAKEKMLREKKSSTSGENRRQLLEENLKQNTIYNQQEMQQDFFYEQSQNSPQSHQIFNNTRMDRGLPTDFSDRMNVQRWESLGGHYQNNNGVFVGQDMDFATSEGILILQNQVKDKVWSNNGGLSLPIELPQHSQTLVFSKVGGKPMLQIGVRSHQATKHLFGWIWFVVIAAITIWLSWQIRAFAAGKKLPLLGILLLLSGLIGFGLFPVSFSWGFLVVAVVGLMLWSLSRPRAVVT